MSANSKVLRISEKTYAAIAGYKEELGKLGKDCSLADVANELIAEGIRAKRSDMWETPFAQALRNVLREVAEADRIDRLEETRQAVLALEGRSLEMRAAAFAVLLGLGLGTNEIVGLYEEGLRLSGSKAKL